VSVRTGTDGLSGIPRLVRATRIGVGALVWAFKHEEAVRLEMLALPFLVWVAFAFGHGGVERALLIGSSIAVLLTELLNTAIEVAIDRIGQERHDLSGLAKDLGSAAVMVALLLWASTWALVLWR